MGPCVDWNRPSASQLGFALCFAFTGHRRWPNGRKFQSDCAEQLMEEHRPSLKLEQNVLSLGLRGAPCILCQRLLDRKTANHSSQMCGTLSYRRWLLPHSANTLSPGSNCSRYCTNVAASPNILCPDILIQLSLLCSAIALHKKPLRSSNLLKLASNRVLWG